MHKTPPNVPANLYQAFVRNRMVRTPIRFVRGILDYKTDPAVEMDDFDEFLSVGDPAPEFTLQTVDGESFSLSDHRGEYVVLEFGSYTCPMYRRQIRGMARLATDWADSDDVTFALVYQTEAHPNQGQFLDVDNPDTYDGRRRLAERLVAEEDVPMTVLVDDVPRNVSTKYGGAPNMVYVVAPDGTIAYRALWTDAMEVGGFLEATVRASH
ncbi:MULTISPECIES: peroxiredoxin [Haloferax]|uniref:Redoxin domain-containing protein n=2 Tax=Haloferax TaxID=2251 RepID=A0A6G1Z1L4_9EURY|nr:MULTISPECIES: deiodinase-like protein [Haloferax]KAB1187765.1 redoxin domain-containing protein [Haloferax sp. CBA1149]MRW80426.1 redoxin domain-containing protein [Haloferax marinisediminis]